MREWVVYAGIMTAVFLVFFQDAGVLGAIAGVLVSGPLYLVFGFVLAKFGYQRKTMKQLRAEKAERSAAGDGAPAGSGRSGGWGGSGGSARRAQTRRTSQGPNRPAKRKKR